jgi:hypothetical protein
VLKWRSLEWGIRADTGLLILTGNVEYDIRARGVRPLSGRKDDDSRDDHSAHGCCPQRTLELSLRTAGIVR